MAIQHWQLQTPIQAISFDCDGTLSKIEGIDELAKNNGVYAEISALTSKAMGTTGLNPALYQQRLDLVLPTEIQVQALGNRYYEERVPDAVAVVAILQRLQKSLYLISAGLFPAVAEFAHRLQIAKENVFAVDIHFDNKGNYTDFDRYSPLISNVGKRQIMSHLRMQHDEIIHIGDGLNDLVTHDLVARFIGYGGVYYRENIELECKYYINTPSLASLLPLILTEAEYSQLSTHEKMLFDQGVAAIEAGKVKTPASRST